MKKLLFFIFIILTIPSFAQYSVGNPMLTHTKHEKKSLRQFNSMKRHKKNVSFRKRSGIAHPAVKRESKRILRSRRYE